MLGRRTTVPPESLGYEVHVPENIRLFRTTSGRLNNGARWAIIPLENKRNFLEVSGGIVGRVDPIFYADPLTAAMKALGIA